MKNWFLKSKKLFLGIFLIVAIFAFSTTTVKAYSKTLARVNSYDGGHIDPSAIKVGDSAGLKAAEKAMFTADAAATNKSGWDSFIRLIRESGSKALSSTLRNALKKIAYDTATYIGSGGRGQKPLFIREGWGEYLGNIGDEAAGEFIETLGRVGTDKWGQFNLCQPNLDVQLKIGLGLKEQYRPKKPVCTFTEMKSNWKNELTRQDFLYRFKSMFNPGGNDLSAAFSMHANIIGEVMNKNGTAIKTRDENKGWIAEQNIAGKLMGAPGGTARDLDFAAEAQLKNFGQFTGDALVDASNVFLNQLAITAFQTAMRKIGEGGADSTQPFDWSSLTNFEAGPSNGGVAGAKNRLNNVIAPKFSVRGDYDILSDLTMCPDPTKAGPTECVITDKFRQAIADKLTVAEAIEQGYLNADMVFGFKNNGIEPKYNEGFSYRSMIILRKFRILPVSWEVVAQKIKKESSPSYSLGDMVACFEANDDYDNYYDSWCEGLVDPNWVLKAPLNYCRREGPGPEIKYEKITGTGADSSLSISRDDNYCADEQTCIDENDDGSCNIYGYCTEERRGWTFGSDSCDSKYNTCQTFQAKDGYKVSYLENTLDSSDCSISNAGCSQYFTSASSYDGTTNNVTWNTSAILTPDLMYFDNDASECSEKNEGCTQLVRTKENLGTNLLPNSSFEESDGSGNFDFWGTFGTENNDSLDGYLSLELPAGTSSIMRQIGPAGYDAAGESYVLSIYAKDCSADTIMGFDEGLIPGSGTASTTIGTTADWSVYRVARSYPSAYFSNQVEIFFNVPAGGSCLIDSIKLERGATPTRYSNYMDTGVIYSKMIPEYLYNDCYQAPSVGNYKLKAGAPLECDNFSRLCVEEEVGCNMYTSIKDNMNIPAKVSAQDYCPDVCVGYDSFLQTKSSFDSEQYQFFIPSTAESCSAQYAGCDEFTNLDKVAEAGESLEYYTNLKQCIKPNSPTANCGEYYTWEGSKETGYQLKVFSLQKGTATTSPAVVSNDSTECSKDVYYASSTSPLYNPDCREYYAKSGDVYYHLDSRTITCSDNCHPYRRTEDNVLKDSSGSNIDSAACSLTTGFAATDGKVGWDVVNSYCVECINGGLWNSQHNACIYNAIPNEGSTCSASQASCREYGGSSGNNVKIILNNSFEGTTQGWIADGAATTSLSNQALMIGGNSLSVSGGTFQASYAIGKKVQKGDGYVLNFIAEADSIITNLSFKFINSTGSTTLFTTMPALSVNSWGIYEINLLNLDHDIDAGEKLLVSGTSDFYIDDIKLTNIRDRYYLIKNSWLPMPNVNGRDICNWDIIADGPAPLYSLGCEQYTDKDSKVYSLRRFTNLCQESAVGCEIIINPYNSDNFAAETLPLSVVTPKVNVPADEYVYAVYDEKKLCDSVDEGCQRMGKATTYEGQILTQDFYVRNNPDQYETTLCSDTAIECREWSTNDGLAYFKDPRDQSCEWRQGKPAAAATGKIDVWSWYKKKVKKCDDNSDKEIDPVTEVNICLDKSDCSGKPCILDENDFFCPTSNIKTFGYGGLGKQVEQPSIDINGYWGGLCPAVESGCTEYIDPISNFSTNLLFNGNFVQNIDSNADADGWEGGTQDIYLDPATLYIFSVEGNNSVTLSTGAAIKYELLENDNAVVTNTGNFLLNPGAGNRDSFRFFTSSPASTLATLTVSDNSAGNSSVISIKKAAIDYQIDTGVDRNSCNGQVSFKDGCVLFNERIGPFTSSNYDAVDLTLDSDRTADPATTESPETGLLPTDNDANALLKVRPDRACNEWLSCKSYVKDDNDNAVCYDIGLCDALDDNGNCKNFVVNNTSPQEQIHSPGNSDVANKTGYSKFAYNGTISSFEEANNYYPFGEMKQVGNILSVTNGNFETYSSDGYPISWINSSGGVWDQQNYKIINNPVEAQNEGVGRNPEGTGFLRLGPAFALESGFIDILPNATYVLSSYINTIKMNSGDARISIKLFDSAGTLAVPTADCPNVVNLYQNFGDAWTDKQMEFCTGLTAAKIKLTLSAVNSPNGNFYFDDIKIKPALASTNLNLTSQECRLYPDTDSLSCEYIEDSGAKQKGWSGYCLEHDTYPGNKDTCLLWWPIDNVKGEGDIAKDNFGGYLGKTPVYLCDTVGADIIPVEVKRDIYLGKTESKSSWWGLSTSGSSSYTGSQSCPSETGSVNVNAINSGYYLRNVVHTKKSSFGFSKKTTVYYYCSPTNAPIATFEGHNWYRYNGNFVNIKGAESGGHNEYEFGMKFYDVSIATFMDPADYKIKCTELHKVVTEDGQNKSWQGRTYPGSDYVVNTAAYTFKSDEAPFGSMVVPNPVHNPYEWDGGKEGGNQAIPLLEESSGLVRAGSPYDCIGAACDQLGYCNISGDLCLNVPKNDVVPSDGGPAYPKCGTKTQQPCYYNWNQSFLPCPNGETCNVNKFNLDLPSLPSPVENMKRIFAKSYGTWLWGPSIGTCDNNSAVTCNSGGDQCPYGSCQTVCSASIAGNLVVSTTVDPTSLVDLPTNCSNSSQCQTGFNYDSTYSGVASFNSANTCETITNPGVCGVGAQSCIDKFCCPVAGTPSETTYFAANGGGDCTTNPSACCSAVERNQCSAYYQGVATAPAPNNQVCAVSFSPCTNNTECVATATCDYGVCDSGTRVNQSCSAPQTCVGSKCNYVVSDSGRYIPTTALTWDVPNVLCPNPDGPRPTAFAGSDYCAVRPSVNVIKIKVNNSNGANVELKQGQTANLTFNSFVEKNQEPLVGYSIFWDGVLSLDSTVVAGIKMNSKPAPGPPHSVYHLYSYADLYQKSLSSSAITCGTSCPSALCSSYTGSYCVVKPLIQIKDNWGWCNGGSSGNICPTTATSMSAFNALIVVTAERAN